MEKTDRELVDSLLAGDADALGIVYDRYADRIYSFAVSMLRNPDDAADVMQDTFVLASRRIDQLRDPDRLRAWLFAIARHCSLRRIEARKRIDAGEVEDMTADGVTLDEHVRQQELAGDVADATASLDERDRVIIGLHMYGDLRGKALAEAIGVNRAHGDVLLGRAKKRLGTALGALLIARHGSGDCESLAAELADWDGTFDVTTRQTVLRHSKRCDICATTRERRFSPAALLGAVPVVVAPAALRARVLDAADAAAGPAAQPHGSDALDGSGRDGFPRGIDASSTLAVGAGAAAVVLVVVALVAALALGGPQEAPSAEQAAAAANSRATATPSAPGAGALGPGSADQAVDAPALGADASPSPTTPDANAPPGAGAEPQIAPGGANPNSEPGGGGAPASEPAPALSVSPNVLDFGAGATTRTVTITNTGGGSLVWSASLVGPPGIWSVSPASGSLGGGVQAAVTVTLDRTGLAAGSISGSLNVSSNAGAIPVKLLAEVVNPGPPGDFTSP